MPTFPLSHKQTHKTNRFALNSKHPHFKTLSPQRCTPKGLSTDSLTGLASTGAQKTNTHTKQAPTSSSQTHSNELTHPAKPPTAQGGHSRQKCRTPQQLPLGPPATHPADRRRRTYTSSDSLTHSRHWWLLQRSLCTPRASQLPGRLHYTHSLHGRAAHPSRPGPSGPRTDGREARTHLSLLPSLKGIYLLYLSATFKHCCPHGQPPISLHQRAE